MLREDAQLIKRLLDRKLLNAVESQNLIYSIINLEAASARPDYSRVSNGKSGLALSSKAINFNEQRKLKSRNER